MRLEMGSIMLNMIKLNIVSQITLELLSRKKQQVLI